MLVCSEFLSGATESEKESRGRERGRMYVGIEKCVGNLGEIVPKKLGIQKV